MCARNRIGLYGGTFDPVHLGHLEVAKKVRTLFDIEHLLFIPAQVAPHKVGRPISSPFHRFAMLALATQDEPDLFVSTFELERPGRTFTVDTLEHFQNVLGESSDLFFIMGADSWTEISTWREWQRLLTMANHVVVTRPGYDIGEADEEIRQRTIDLRPSSTKRAPAEISGSGHIFITDVVMKDISATQIRRASQAGEFENIASLVPGPVGEYIRKYGIYRESNEAELND